MDIKDENGKSIDITRVEKDEQYLANRYIQENDIVLELGARYGSVSCIINSKLKCKTNQVVVEPDNTVWGALELNKKVNNCEFHIVKGFISKKKLGLTGESYGKTFIYDNDTNIESFSLQEIEAKYNLKFDVLVADCEGFLEIFFDENPELYDTLRLFIFEADYTEKCDYQKIINTLEAKGFTKIVEGHQNVWVKL